MPWRYLAISILLLLSLFLTNVTVYPRMNIDDCLTAAISCPIDFCRDKKIDEWRSRQQNIELLWLRYGDVRFRTICSWLILLIIYNTRHRQSRSLHEIGITQNEFNNRS